jgi:hypothetical protein
MAITRVETSKGKFVWMDGDTVMDPQPKSIEEALEIANRQNAELAAAAGGGRKQPTGLDYKIEGTKMTIVLDLSQSNGVTKGQKQKDGTFKGGGNTMIATTHGNLPVEVRRPDGKVVSVSVNAYAK